MTPGLLLHLGGAMAAFLAAASALRLHAGQAAAVSAPLVAALALYTVGNLMMVRLMREAGGMAAAMSVAAVLQLVLVNLVAILAFGERPAPTQLLGIALGVVATVLILVPVRPAP